MKRIAAALIFALSLSGLASLPIQAFADVSVSISVGFAPPVLPVYPQPIIPGPGYLWTPGYWAYGPEGYFWVPGTWVLPPQPGVLWTPGYWAFEVGVYRWHPGYWGPHVGYYGGVNYGYGYTGHGYQGGYWHGRDFYYNRSVNNVTVTNIHNTYVRDVPDEPRGERPAFNGGTGGVVGRPTADEQNVEREQHNQPTAVQVQHKQAAHDRPGQRFTPGNGQPEVAATRKPGGFTDNDTVRWNRASRSYGNANHNARSPAPRQNGHGHPPRR